MQVLGRKLNSVEDSEEPTTGTLEGAALPIFGFMLGLVWMPPPTMSVASGLFKSMCIDWLIGPEYNSGNLLYGHGGSKPDLLIFKFAARDKNTFQSQMQEADQIRATADPK